MRRTEQVQGLRLMKFEEVYGRTHRGGLSQAEAAEVLGVSERTFRRWRDRYEAEGADGLYDRRLGRLSARRAPVDEVARVLELFDTRYWDFTAKHFHEKLVADHGFKRSYNWLRLSLQAHGRRRAAPRRGAHRRKRPRRALPGMMLHQDGSSHEWVPGRWWDLIVTMDDATSDIYSAFFVAEEGTMSSFQGVSEAASARSADRVQRDRKLRIETGVVAGGVIVELEKVEQRRPRPDIAQIQALAPAGMAADDIRLEAAPAQALGDPHGILSLADRGLELAQVVVRLLTGAVGLVVADFKHPRMAQAAQVLLLADGQDLMLRLVGEGPCQVQVLAREILMNEQDFHAPRLFHARHPHARSWVVTRSRGRAPRRFRRNEDAARHPRRRPRRGRLDRDLGIGPQSARRGRPPAAADIVRHPPIDA